MMRFCRRNGGGQIVAIFATEQQDSEPIDDQAPEYIAFASPPPLTPAQEAERMVQRNRALRAIVKVIAARFGVPVQTIVDELKTAAD